MAELVLAGVTKSYGGAVALQEASLECVAGEVHGLIGENGAGKSTLIKILAGAVYRDAGVITLDGHEFVDGGSRAAMAAGIGAVFQELSLMPDLTVAQNIFFGREPLDMLRGTSARRLREAAYQLFDQLGVDVADPDRPVRELPLAQRQMVEIAKVLGRDPRVVIFDEATAALGRSHADWLLRHCAQLAAAGKMVIFISHHLREIREVSDRITVYRNGRDVATRTRATADTDELVSLMVGRRLGQLFPPRTQPVAEAVALEGRGLASGSRLRGVDFTVRRGEILGIGGLTGQGQEDLCRLIYGVKTGDGQLRLDGHPVAVANPSQALERGIALVPEDRATQGLLLPKSVSTNMSLAVLSRLARFGIIDRGAERREVRSAIVQLSIKALDAEVPVQRLSGGNQQKVVLAKLLATRPRVLVLLDSTRGVDVATKAEIYQLLRELCAGGSSVLLYSTDNEELIHLCDRVIVMRRGRVEAELSGPTLTDANLIRASMGEPIAAAGPETGEREVGTPEGEIAPDAPEVALAAVPVVAGPTRDPEAVERDSAGKTMRYGRRARLDPFSLFPVALFVSIVLAIVAIQPSLVSASFLETKANAALSLILVTMGQTMVILSGGIDLSVGGVVSVSNALAATQMRDDPGSIVLWCLLISLFGLGAGLLNGFIVAVMRVTPFIATLATWSIWSGAALLVMEQDGGRVAPGFRAIIRTHIGFLSGSLTIVIALVVVWWLFKRSRPGVQMYAVGSDSRAAARSGAQVRRTLFMVYGLSGLLAAMAGLYRVVQVGSGSPVAGDGFILTSVAAVLIGGTSLAGGRGGFVMSLLGALILLTLTDLIFFAGVSTFYTPMVQGALLIAAVAINSLGYRMSLRRARG